MQNNYILDNPNYFKKANIYENIMINRKEWRVLSLLTIFFLNLFLQGNTYNYSNYDKKCKINSEPYLYDIYVRSYLVPGVSESIKLKRIVKIGILNDMNDITGEHAWNGALLAAREINEGGGILISGTQYYIGIVSEDTKEVMGTIEDGIKAAKCMIKKHDPHFIMGGSERSLINYLEVVMNNKIPFLGTGNFGTIHCQNVLDNYERYKYFFRVMPYNATAWGVDVGTYIMYLANYLSIIYGGIVDKLAIIRSDDWFTYSIYDAFKDFFPYIGLTVVEHIAYPLNATSEDFANYWSDIETAGAQITLSIGFNTQQVELVDQQYQEVKPNCIVYDLSTYLPSHLASYWDDTSGACQFKIVHQSIHNISKTPLTKPFWNNYINVYGVEPLFTGAGSYSAVYLLKRAVNESQSFNSDTIIKTLEKINSSNPFTGAAGNLAFTRSHDLLAGYPFAHMIFCQWKYIDGTKVVIPTGNLIYPDSLATDSLRLPYWGINGLLTDPPDPPGDFTLEHDADNPDYDGKFNLNWTDSGGADNYSVYMSNSPIIYISKKFDLLAYQTATSPFPISLKQGDYYFSVVAYNKSGETMSSKDVHVAIPGPGSFNLYTDADDPDTDGEFNLIWTSSERADNYSVYYYNKMIIEINESLTLLSDQTTATSFHVTKLPKGKYYFAVAAWNEMGLTLSTNSINNKYIIVRLPPENIDMIILSVILIISIGSVIGIAYILLKKRYPKHKG